MAKSSKLLEPLTEPPDSFPYDLDSVLPELGKSGRKHNVVELLKREFKPELDYIVIKKKGIKRHIYFLSYSCFLKVHERVSKRDDPEERTKQELINKERLKVRCKRAIKNKIHNRIHKKIVDWVDIFTDKEIIEIKRADEWKDAIGQVLACRVYFKDLEPRLHIFTIPEDKRTEIYKSKEARQLVEEVCRELKIKITWHDFPSGDFLNPN